MGKFLAFKLEALEANNTKLVEYGNSFAFMMGAVDKLSAKVNKKKKRSPSSSRRPPRPRPP